MRCSLSQVGGSGVISFATCSNASADGGLPFHTSARSALPTRVLALSAARRLATLEIPVRRFRIPCYPDRDSCSASPERACVLPILSENPGRIIPLSVIFLADFPDKQGIRRRRPVSRDCVRHQEVRANRRDFLIRRIVRHFRDLRRQQSVCQVYSTVSAASLAARAVESLWAQNSVSKVAVCHSAHRARFRTSLGSSNLDA